MTKFTQGDRVRIHIDKESSANRGYIGEGIVVGLVKMTPTVLVQEEFPGIGTSISAFSEEDLSLLPKESIEKEFKKGDHVSIYIPPTLHQGGYQGSGVVEMTLRSREGHGQYSVVVKEYGDSFDQVTTVYDPMYLMILPPEEYGGIDAIRQKLLDYYATAATEEVIRDFEALGAMLKRLNQNELAEGERSPSV